MATQEIMQALVLIAPGEVAVQQWPVPAVAQDDEVLVRVAMAGICGSELEAVATRSPRRVPPLIMGHEFTGRIAALGAAVRGWKVGDRVVPNPLFPCGRCEVCRQGRENACPNRVLLGLHRHGGHAGYVCFPAHLLHRVPDRLTDEHAAATEPLAVAVHAARLLGGDGVLPQRVAVFGAGTIGLFALQVAQVAGATTTLISDVDEARLAVARRLGTSRTVNPSTEGDLLRVALDMTAGAGFDAAIDAVGRAETRTAAVQVLRPGGTAVWVGSAQDETTVRGHTDVVLGEKRIQGAYGYTDGDFGTALGLLAAGRIEAASWSRVYPLAEGAALFDRLLRHAEPCIKALLMPEGRNP